MVRKWVLCSISPNCLNTMESPCGMSMHSSGGPSLHRRHLQHSNKRTTCCSKRCAVWSINWQLLPLLLLFYQVDVCLCVATAVQGWTAAGGLQAPTYATQVQVAGLSCSDPSPSAQTAATCLSSGAGTAHSTRHSSSPSAVARRETSPAPACGLLAPAMQGSTRRTSRRGSQCAVRPGESVTGSVTWQCLGTLAWRPCVLS